MTRFRFLDLIACLLFATGARGFTWVSSSSVKSKSTTTVHVIPPGKEIGVLPPVGFFDPLGLLKVGPYGNELANFRRYRSVEVKHGRIAMLATLGILVQENYHFQGYISPSQGLKFDDIPNGLGALSVVPLEGLVQIAVLIGLHEIFIKEREGKAPGDFGTGYWGVSMDDQSSKQLRALNVEIQNGRLAMLGILGMFASEIVHNGNVLAETKIFG